MRRFFLPILALLLIAGLLVVFLSPQVELASSALRALLFSILFFAMLRSGAGTDVLLQAQIRLWTGLSPLPCSPCQTSDLVIRC